MTNKKKKKKKVWVPGYKAWPYGEYESSPGVYDPNALYFWVQGHWK